MDLARRHNGFNGSFGGPHYLPAPFVPFKLPPDKPVWLRFLDKIGSLGGTIFTLFLHEYMPLEYGWNEGEDNILYTQVRNLRQAEEIVDGFSDVVVSEILLFDPRDVWGWYSGKLPHMSPAHRVKYLVRLDFYPCEGTSSETYYKIFNQYSQLPGPRILRVRDKPQLEVFVTSEEDAKREQQNFDNRVVDGVKIRSAWLYTPDCDEVYAYLRAKGLPPNRKSRTHEYLNDIIDLARLWSLPAEIRMEIEEARSRPNKALIIRHPPKSTNRTTPYPSSSERKATSSGRQITKNSATSKVLPFDTCYNLEDAQKAQKKLEISFKTWSSRRLSDVMPVTDLPRFDPEVPTCSVESLTQDAFSWHKTANRPPPSQLALDLVLNLFGGDPSRLQAFETIRRGMGDPMLLISLLANNQTVHVDEPAIYGLLLRVSVEDGMVALGRVGNISNEQRERIQREAGRRIQYFKVHRPHVKYFWMPYVGFSTRPDRRPGLDMINISFHGEPSQDKRAPLMQMMDVGAGVNSLTDHTVISWQAGKPIIDADEEVLESGEFPPVVRVLLFPLRGQPTKVWHTVETTAIGVFSPLQLNVNPGGDIHLEMDNFLSRHFPIALADVEDPLEEVHVISDATGVHGNSFEESSTGRLIANGLYDLQGGKEKPLHITDCHPHGWWSNDCVLTLDDQKRVISAVTSTNHFLVSMGSVVALPHVCSLLLNGGCLTAAERHTSNTIAVLFPISTSLRPVDCCDH